MHQRHRVLIAHCVEYIKSLFFGHKICLMKNYFTLVVICMMMLLFARCKEVYDPQIQASNTKLLVVEGFLNSGQGPTIIRLSRTTDVNDTILKPEIGAQLIVEGNDGSKFSLFENGGGEYGIDQLQLNGNAKYRLDITTVDGKHYASDYSPVKNTPPIDSITWQRENGGVRIYVSAHDPLNATKYYQWKFEETWEFHSAYFNSLEYIRDNSTGKVIDLQYKNPYHTVDTTIYQCWNTLNSSSILLGTTEKLTSDVVYLPVQYIEPHSEKLSVLYSINLRQYAISQDNYLFLQKMKKNTEQLGTLFDPQPSEISGNIHCLTNPGETVIGYVEVSQEQVKRIFISTSQVPDWNYNPACTQIEIVNNLDSIAQQGSDLMPTLPAKISPLGTIVSFYASTPPCVDCTLRGVHQKPSFWP
jgi:hypothetical protein